MSSGFCCFLQLPQGENHGYGGPIRAEAALGFWEEPLCKDLEPSKEHTNGSFTHNAVQRYTLVVVAITFVAFVLRQRDDVDIMHVLGDANVVPAY